MRETHLFPSVFLLINRAEYLWSGRTCQYRYRGIAIAKLILSLVLPFFLKQTHVRNIQLWYSVSHIYIFIYLVCFSAFQLKIGPCIHVWPKPPVRYNWQQDKLYRPYFELVNDVITAALQSGHYVDAYRLSMCFEYSRLNYLLTFLLLLSILNDTGYFFSLY